MTEVGGQKPEDRSRRTGAGCRQGLPQRTHIAETKNINTAVKLTKQLISLFSS